MSSLWLRNFTRNHRSLTHFPNPARAFASEIQKDVAVISILGPDTPGLVGEFSKVLRDSTGNVVSSRMARLGGEAALITTFSLAGEKLENFTKLIEKKFPGYTIRTRLKEEEPTPIPSNATEYRVTFEGPDSPGIVAAIADAVSDSKHVIRDMKTETTVAPFAGFPLFKVRLSVFATDETVSSLESSLQKSVGEKFGLDASVSLQKKTK